MTPNNNHRVIIFLLFMLLLSSCASFAEDVTPPPGYQPPPPPEATSTPEGLVYPPTMPDPERGEPIFFEKCAPCHGNTGKGDGPSAADLPNPVAAIGSKEVAHQSTPAEWYAMVSRGNLERYMPPFNSLSVTQRWDALAYVYGLSVTEDELVEGQSLFLENCAACHGANGDGTGPEAGTLSKIPGDFTNQALMAEQSSLMFFETITNGHGEMQAFGDLLTDPQRWILTDYVRALSFQMSLPNTDALASDSAEDAEQPSQTGTPSETSAEADPTAEPASKAGSITVSITHGAGADLPSSLETTLYIYDGMTDPELRSSVASQDGMVVFEDVEFIEGLYYIASVEYQQVAFGSSFFQADAETTEALLDITIFDTTTSTDAVSIDRLHIFFEFGEPDILQVVQLLLLTNSSPSVITPPEGQEASIAFSLPQGAYNLWLPSDTTLPLFETADGVGVSNIRPAGEPYEIMFAFDMPYEDNKLDIALPINFNTGAVIVMAPESGVKLKSDQLQAGEARDLEGMAFQSFSGSSLQAGEMLSISISGWPKTSAGAAAAAGEDPQSGLVIGLLVFGVTLLVAGIYLWYKSKSDQQLPDGMDVLDDAESVDDLMDSIVALDDIYQAGELPESAYQARREQLKQQLQSVIDAEK